MTPSHRKPHVVFVYKGNRTQLLESYRTGQAPDEFLYGMPYIDTTLFDVAFVEDPTPPTSLIGRALMPFERRFGERFWVGFALHSYLRTRKQLRSADVIVSTTDSYGLPILMQKHRDKIGAKLVCISMGLYVLADKARENRFNAWVRNRIDCWLGRADAFVVLGDGDAVALRQSFPELDPSKIRTIQFGIDEHFWSPGAGGASAAEPFILSVGSDMKRDYPTLLRAANDWNLTIVTRSPLPTDLLTSRVRVLSKMPWGDLRELYRKSRFVISPIKNVPQDSGHSATLQAMACGKAVILSDTPGLWDRSGMRHRETCWLVPPENVGALREAITFFKEHLEEAERIGRNARRLVEERYTSKQFGEALQKELIACAGNPN